MTSEMFEPIQNWREAAACLGSDVNFFPAPEDKVGIDRARSICAGCPVSEECLIYAIETNQSEGVWGGTDPRERAKLRRHWVRDLRRAS